MEKPLLENRPWPLQILKQGLRSLLRAGRGGGWMVTLELPQSQPLPGRRCRTQGRGCC